MSGYLATSASILDVAIGVQILQAQSALSYIPGDTIQITYALNTAIFMIGQVSIYNAVTGLMTVNVTSLSDNFLLQAPFNTQVWGGTTPILSDWNLSFIGGIPLSSGTTVQPTILVRQLSATWDPQRGNGLANFLTDGAAVAQIIAQRLKLLQGEWYENLNLGTPLFQNLLGHAQSTQGVALILRQQILAVPYVTGITAFGVTQQGRSFSFQAVVSTQFGPVSVAGN